MNISVALCTFNGEKYISDQLLSIIGQSKAVKEIVISDDGSTDATVSLIQKFKSEQNLKGIEIKLFQNPSPLGISKNFEKCLSLTSHEWVFLSDQDDVWLEDKVALFQNHILKNPDSKFVCSNAEITDSNNNKLGYTLVEALNISRKELHQLNSGQAFDVLLSRNLATGATCLVHKSIYENALPFSDYWLHDEWMAINAAFDGSINFLVTPTINYRQHGNNAVGMLKKNFRRRISKYREPRNERNLHLLNRAYALVEFLGTNVVSTLKEQQLGKLIAAQNYLQFQNGRFNTPANRLIRWVPLSLWLVQGKYGKYGRGFKDYFKDVVQPDKKHSVN
jgi:glycosyltransferase involved in cell wall biosynthesis